MHRRTVRAVRAADASAPCVSSSPRSAARPISAGAATPAACPAAPGHVAASTAHVQVSARARSPGCRQKSHTAPTPIAKRTSSAVRRDAARSSRTCSGVRTVCARCRAAHAERRPQPRLRPVVRARAAQLRRLDRHSKARALYASRDLTEADGRLVIRQACAAGRVAHGHRMHPRQPPQRAHDAHRAGAAVHARDAQDHVRHFCRRLS